MKKSKQISEAEAPNYEFSKKHKHKKHTFLITGMLLVLLLITSCLIQISLTNSLITEGITLSQIQQQIDQTKKENLIIAEKLYTNSSYTHIASEAANLGFIEAKSAVYLTDPMPLAINQ